MLVEDVGRPEGVEFFLSTSRREAFIEDAEGGVRVDRVAKCCLECRTELEIEREQGDHKTTLDV